MKHATKANTISGHTLDALSQAWAQAGNVTHHGGKFLAAPGYESLADVLARAFEQASAGKGAERHAQAKPFDTQPMQGISDLVGIGFPLGQAIKKVQESLRLSPDAAVREMLGAINYFAGAVIFLEKHTHG